MGLDQAKIEYCLLDRLDRIKFLEWVRQDNQHLWDYSTYPESLRRFYSNEPRIDK